MRDANDSPITASATAPVRVMIVDDHDLIRLALRALLRTSKEVDVVALASSGPEAVRLAAKHCPQVVLTDLNMPGMNGVETTKAILARLPEARVIILSGHIPERQLTEAMRAGAAGCLVKTADRQELLSAIHAAHRGDRCLSQDLARDLRLSTLAPAEC